MFPSTERSQNLFSAPSAPLKCKNGHPLKLMKRNYLCDVCDDPRVRKGPSLCCLLCNYDHCPHHSINIASAATEATNPSSCNSHPPIWCNEPGTSIPTELLFPQLHCRGTSTPHGLKMVVRKCTWICDVCEKSYPAGSISLHCIHCDYDECCHHRSGIQVTLPSEAPPINKNRNSSSSSTPHVPSAPNISSTGWRRQQGQVGPNHQSLVVPHHSTSSADETKEQKATTTALMDQIFGAEGSTTVHCSRTTTSNKAQKDREANPLDDPSLVVLSSPSCTRKKRSITTTASTATDHDHLSLGDPLDEHSVKSKLDEMLLDVIGLPTSEEIDGVELKKRDEIKLRLPAAKRITTVPTSHGGPAEDNSILSRIEQRHRQRQFERQILEGWLQEEKRRASVYDLAPSINVADDPQAEAVYISHCEVASEILVSDVVGSAGIARTTMTLVFTNASTRDLEGEAIIPLAEDAVVGSYSLDFNGTMVPASLVEAKLAEKVYDVEVKKGNQVATMSKVTAGGNTFKTKVHPLPARGTRRLAITFTQSLEPLFATSSCPVGSSLAIPGLSLLERYQVVDSNSQRSPPTTRNISFSVSAQVHIPPPPKSCRDDDQPEPFFLFSDDSTASTTTTVLSTNKFALSASISSSDFKQKKHAIKTTLPFQIIIPGSRVSPSTAEGPAGDCQLPFVVGETEGDDIYLMLTDQLTSPATINSSTTTKTPADLLVQGNNNRICIIWDASLSRYQNGGGEGGIKREISFLEKTLAEFERKAKTRAPSLASSSPFPFINDTTTTSGTAGVVDGEITTIRVDLFIVRDTTEAYFNLTSKEALLKVHPENCPLDGATNLQSLAPHLTPEYFCSSSSQQNSVNCVLLFSDGQSSFGEGRIPHLEKNSDLLPPIFAIVPQSSQKMINRSQLEHYWCKPTGGTVLQLPDGAISGGDVKADSDSNLMPVIQQILRGKDPNVISSISCCFSANTTGDNAAQLLLVENCSFVHQKKSTSSSINGSAGVSVTVFGKIPKASCRQLFSDSEESHQASASPPCLKIHVNVGGQGLDAECRVYTLSPTDIKISTSASSTSSPSSSTGLVSSLWAQARVAELEVFPERNNGEILRLGRQYGIVTSSTSLIILDTLQQHLDHDIEPHPARKALRDEFIKKRSQQRADERDRAEKKIQGPVSALWLIRMSWYDKDFTLQPSSSSSTTDSGNQCSSNATTFSTGHLVSRLSMRSSSGGGLLSRLRSRSRSINNSVATTTTSGSGVIADMPASNRWSEHCRRSDAAPRQPAAAIVNNAPHDECFSASLRSATSNGWGCHSDRPMTSNRSSGFHLQQQQQQMSSSAYAQSRCTSASTNESDGDSAAAACNRGAIRNPDTTATNPAAKTAMKYWSPDTPYLSAIKNTGPSLEVQYKEYLRQRDREGYFNTPAFYLDVGAYFLDPSQLTDERRRIGIRVLSNIAELGLDNSRILRVLGYKFFEAKEWTLAREVFCKVARFRPNEPQSFRDLGLTFLESGWYQQAVNMLWRTVIMKYPDSSFDEIEIECLWEIKDALRRAAKRGVSIKKPDLLEKYSNTLLHLNKETPLDLRITLAWDQDSVDIDLHVIDRALQEEAYYGHKETRAGGLMSKDFTRGYGPESFVQKSTSGHNYRVLGSCINQFDVKARYYASHQPSLTGPTTAILSVTTGFLTDRQETKHTLIRLKTQGDNGIIGSVSVAN